VLRIYILYVSTIFLLDFGTVPTVWYFVCVFYFFNGNEIQMHGLIDNHLT
jgi:hypothetical protein